SRPSRRRQPSRPRAWGPSMRSGSHPEPWTPASALGIPGRWGHPTNSDAHLHGGTACQRVQLHPAWLEHHDGGRAEVEDAQLLAAADRLRIVVLAVATGRP